MELKELILTEMQNTDSIKIGYECDHHTNNSDFINVYIGKTKYKQVEGNDTKPFQTELEKAVSELTAIIPNIHLVKRQCEFHFSYPGFNSVHHEFVAVEITTDTNKQTKPRIKTESYSMCGWSKLKEIIDKHPDYELYERSGFAFRGARESQCTIEDLKRLCEWSACIDITVIDNEIHVNGFSANDMW